MIGANDTAREYAAAMYALAMEDADAAGKPEKVDEYLSRSEEIRGIVRDFPEWIDMLASPCIRIDERRKAVDEVLLVGKNNEREIYMIRSRDRRPTRSARAFIDFLLDRRTLH